MTLATFTGLADLAAGTLEIRPSQEGQSFAPGTANFAIPEPGGVTVANVPGTFWKNESTEHGCGLVPTWGGRVTVTNRYSGSYVSGVYAQIYDFTGGTGNEACNSNAAPSDFDLSMGIWSYQVVATTSSEVTWAFDYVTGSQFTFRGRILGAKLTHATATQPIRGPARANGSSTAFPVENGIGFVAADGTVSATTDLTGFPRAVAPDSTNGRIWYASLYGVVGYTNGTGGADQHIHWSYAAPVDEGRDIAVDATDATKAWLLTSDYGLDGNHGGLRAVTLSPLAFGDTSATFSGTPGALVAAPGTLYVTNTTNSTIDVWAIPAMSRTSYATSGVAGCGSPDRMLLHSSGDVWFTASAAICKMTAAGVVSKVADAVSPTGICMGSDGNVWYAREQGLVRVVAGETTPWVVDAFPAFSVGNHPSCTTGSGGFWAASDDGGVQLVRYEP